MKYQGERQGFFKSFTLYVYQCLKNEPSSHKISHDKTLNILGTEGIFLSKIQAIYKKHNIIKTISTDPQQLHTQW